jgi:hypothetical protein
MLDEKSPIWVRLTLGLMVACVIAYLTVFSIVTYLATLG